jgi:hypothetical protein
MSSKAYAERLARALESTGLAEIVDCSHSENQVRVLCRVADGGQVKWLGILKNILILTEAEQKQAHSWQAHICRLYLLKRLNGEPNLVFGWNVSIQSLNMPDSLDYLSRVIRGESPDAVSSSSSGEVMEMEFTGMTGSRIPNAKGKGAYTVGGSSDFKGPKAR